MGFPNFVIDTECEFHGDFEKLFVSKGPDISDQKLTFNGHQFDVIGNPLVDWKKVRDWTLQKIVSTGVTNIEILKAWCIDYNDNGYQSVHKHGVRSLSVVVSLDNQPTEDKTGILYTISSIGKGNLMYKEFKPRKGRTVIMSGGVYHGVYPTKNPRRTFVVDYKIKGMSNGI